LGETTVKRILSIFSIVLAALALSWPFLPASRAQQRPAAPAAAPDAGNPEDALKQGRALLKRGQADQALAKLQAALKGYQSANNAKGVAGANDALGDLYLQQGQYKVALGFYQQAYDGFVAATGQQSAMENIAGFPDNQYNANLMLAKIGQASFQAGDLSSAAAAFSRMNAAKPDPTKFAGVNPSSMVSGSKPSTGSITGAARGGLGGVFGGSKPKAPTVSAPTGVTDALSAARGAIEFYRQAVVFSLRETGAGRLDYLNGNFAGAQKRYTEALGAASLPLVSSLGQMRRLRASARTALGDIMLQQNKPKDAAKLYQDAINGAQADKRLDLTWPAQRGLARSLWLQAAAEKDPKKGLQGRDQSIAKYREAVATIEAIRAGSLRADESRTTFLATTEIVYEEGAQVSAEAALLAANLPNGGPLSGPAINYAATGFQFTEQGRARSLLDMLGESGVNLTAGVPADLLAKKQANLARQQEIAGILTGVAFSGDDKNAPDAKKLDEELAQLDTEFDAIENQIRTANPRYASVTAPQPFTLADVQQKVVDEQTALLEYNLGRDASYLWVVTNGVALYKLPGRDALNKQAQDLRAAIVPTRYQRRLVGIDVATDTRGFGLVPLPPSEGVQNFANASNALYQTTVAPAKPVIGDKRLLIVPDGMLNYVPFEALVSGVQGADYSALPYLINSNEVIYAPSASVVGFMRQASAPAPAGKNMLIVADPVFYGADPRARGAAAANSQTAADARGLGLVTALSDVSGGDVAPIASAAGLPLARLIGTRQEATQITATAKKSGGTADVWLDLEANEANVNARDLKKYRVLHIATHGLLNAEHPQFTGVVLSLVGNKTGDGFLRADEIFNLNLSRPLVILSACETGLGREKRGEGVIGLTRAFMYAGAPTVGVSLWPVSDAATAQLMSDFYAKYLAASGGSPTTSMRAAQRAMITGKKYSAPFYWSPFVLNGEWR
jgi:CHAT domain-containing protein/tetratricopeptide (TPR) repeat protein